MHKLDLEKAAEPEVKLSTFIGSWRKQGSFRMELWNSRLTFFAQYFEYVLLFSPGSKSLCLKFADKQMGFPCM